jgi:uncharacterized spore protein YtfJ
MVVPRHSDLSKLGARFSSAGFIVQPIAVIEVDSEVWRILPYDIKGHSMHGFFVKDVPENWQERIPKMA